MHRVDCRVLYLCYNVSITEQEIDMAGQRWTDEEIEYVKANYGTLTSQQIGEKIGKTSRAVRHAANRIGLNCGWFEWDDGKDGVLIEMYESRLPVDEIALALNTTRTSVVGRAQRLGVKQFENRTWTDAETEYILTNYNKIPAEQVAKDIGRTTSAVHIKAQKLNLRSGMYKEINHDFFKTPSPEREYVLGFIAADGSVTGNTLSIEIDAKDAGLLTEIRDAMGSTHKISTSNRKNTVYWRAHSDTITEDLISLGVVHRKSWDLVRVNYHPQYFNHFVRGYFDGDGSMGIHKRDRALTASFSGAHAFLTNLRDDLINVGLNPYGITRQKETVSAFGFWNKSAIAFCEWMYEGAGVYLERKKDIYLKATR